MILLRKLSTIGLLLLAYIVAVIRAQGASSVVSATASASNAAATLVITVGQADHKFVPAVTQANIGDIIEFQFFPANHSVVRAEYLHPCIPYEMTGRGKVGFFSGFHPVDAILSNPPIWHVQINDTNPIFFYCSAPGSCINYQMVGVINPSANTSLELQKAAAKNSAYMLQPNEPFPEEGGPTSASSSSAGASSTTTATLVTVTSSAASASSSAAAATSSPGGLSVGAIAGIAVGAVAILLLAAALCFFVGRSRSLKKEVARQDQLGLPGMSRSHEHNSFLPSKGRAMTDISSRHSGAASPRYESFVPMGIPISETKGYVLDVQETDYNGGRSPVNGYGYPPHTAPTIHSPGIRHPSDMLNPNQPHEMESGEVHSNWNHRVGGSDRS